MTLTCARPEWIDRFVMRATALMPGLSWEDANAAARKAFNDDGWKRQPEMAVVLHMRPAPADPVVWHARFAAELLRLIPTLNGLDAVRAAKQEYERQHHLDGPEAARNYAEENAGRK
jgi:hypothetical protein